MYILISLLCVFAFAMGNEPIVVNITAQNQLLPLSLSPIQDDSSALPAEYIHKLEEILRFDLNFNGMTYVTDPQKTRVLYSIETKISNKSLSAKLAKQNSIKMIDGILLTGNLNEDRQKIHQVANAIFKELFHQEGIADTHLLYTVKMQSGSKAISEVAICDYDGGNPRTATDQRALCVSPCFIPSKPGFITKNFAYVSYKTGQPKIYFNSLDENSARRFSLIKGNQLMPAFSPSCDKIAFICDVTGNPDLFLQNLDSSKNPIGKPWQLFSSSYGTQASPTFSPDGSKIAFVSNKDGAPRIYIASIPQNPSQKAQATLLTKKNRENTSPCWSPDGKKIAYSAITKNVRQIWIYDFDSGEEKQLTDGPHHKENPSFAPNSLHIAYNSTEGGQSEIFIINLNQPKAVRITGGKGDKRFPSWEPRFKTD